MLPRLEEPKMVQYGQPDSRNDDVVNGYCVVGMDPFLGNDDEWPEEFCAIPRAGDFVRSKSGTTLKVIQVTFLVRGYPTFEVLLGKDVSSSSPMEGGTPEVGID